MFLIFGILFLVLSIKNSINIKITGQAGEGIKTTGLILSKIFTRSGFHIFSYDEYPSLIRGGHNCYQMYASTEKVFSQHKKVDILIALDEASVSLHQDELTKKSLVLFDPDEFQVKKSKGKLLPIPWAKIATDSGGSPIMSNMVALGVVCGVTGLSLNPIFSLIKDVFGRKGEKIVSANKKAAQAGFDYVKKPTTPFLPGLHQASSPQLRGGEIPQMVVTGNEMIGLGAISAGLKYFAGYPMTPVSNLLHFLAAKAENYSMIVNHTENEIGAINTAIGASAAGARAMTATSGGGFSLMTEGLGLSGMSETPLVIVEGMRPGPSSGMPTWTGQGDLLFMVYASQDEFPRIVLTPGSINECFSSTQKAFYFAEKYQIPVIILTDKHLLESHKSCSLHTPEVKSANTSGVYLSNKRYSFVKNPGKNYLRYKVTDTGISPRPFLGQKGAACLTNSYEHGEDSLVTEESLPRKKQVEKRMRKLETLKNELWQPKLFGKLQAKINLIGWGSTLGPVLETIKQNQNINYLHLDYIWPFPKKAVKNFLQKSKKPICIEGNAAGQLAKLIAQETGILIKDKLLKYDGRPFWPEEILKFAKFA